MMNFFGKKKKDVNTVVSSTSASKPSDAQTTIVKLRESIANQDKRSVGRVVATVNVQSTQPTKTKIIWQPFSCRAFGGPCDLRTIEIDDMAVPWFLIFVFVLTIFIVIGIFFDFWMTFKL